MRLQADLTALASAAKDNRSALHESSARCCYHCCRPVELANIVWQKDTAICPHCGVDAVVPFALTAEEVATYNALLFPCVGDHFIKAAKHLMLTSAYPHPGYAIPDAWQRRFMRIGNDIVILQSECTPKVYCVLIQGMLESRRAQHWVYVISSSEDRAADVAKKSARVGNPAVVTVEMRQHSQWDAIPGRWFVGIPDSRSKLYAVKCCSITGAQTTSHVVASSIALACERVRDNITKLAESPCFDASAEFGKGFEVVAVNLVPSQDFVLDPDLWEVP